jgi:hypothetical protein
LLPAAAAGPIDLALNMLRLRGTLQQSALPDGIEPHHIHEAHGSLLVRWPLDVCGLGALLLLAFLGVFGVDAKLAGTGAGVSLVIEGPARIRNGNVFDTALTIETQRQIRDLIVLVDEAVWYEVTLNTVLPEPEQYGFRDGAFELRFGELESGERLLIKISAQINSGRSPSTNAGKIAIADGDDILTALDYSLEVLP